MIREIVKYPDPRLRQVAVPVTEYGTQELKSLVGDMYDTMVANNGCGIAACQIGDPHAVCLVKFKNHHQAFVNPKIGYTNFDCSIEPEGCLSIPGKIVYVGRSVSQVTIIWNDPLDGKVLEWTFSENEARILRHEIDHLNGKLITDYETL